MATYNLATTYEKKLDERFRTKSYTDRFTGHGYDFLGKNAIKLWTVDDITMNDYAPTGTLGSRLGTMQELGDELNTYTLTQFKSIRATYEKSKDMDQDNIHKRSDLIKNFNDRVLLPAIDKYRLDKWAAGCGQAKTMTASLSKTNIIETILAGNAMLDNAWVPLEGRVAFISVTDSIKVNLADELKYADKYIEKGAVRGEVAELGGLHIVRIPDALMPAGVKILIKQASTTVDPRVLDYLHEFPQVEGYFGPVINGVFRYDAFVLAQKANGIIAIADDATKICADPVVAVSSSKMAITSTTSGAVIKYSVDGSNPKAEGKGTTYSAAVNLPASGTVVKAYAEKDGLATSGVVAYKYNGTDFDKL